VTDYTLSGVCYDINGDTVASAVVKVFDTATDTLQGSDTADSVGAYTVSLTVQGPLYAVAYHANSPDIAGTTLNTLMAVEVSANTDDDDYAAWMQAA
jgi:hypothetical protein